MLVADSLLEFVSELHGVCGKHFLELALSNSFAGGTAENTYTH